MRIYFWSVMVAAFLTVTAFAEAAEPLVAEKDFPGKFSANVGLTTEYIYRGLSQTDDQPALQGGFDYEHESGLSAGIWASNVDFNDGSDGASVEIDYYAAFSGEVKGVSWSVGGIYYSYPGVNDDFDYDFFEANASLGYGFGPVAATLGINYAPDFFGGSGDAVYLTGDAEVPLGRHFDLAVHVGRQWVEKEDVYGVPDYIDYSVGIGASLVGFDLGLAWSDTDHSDSECSDACGQVLFTVSRSI